MKTLATKSKQKKTLMIIVTAFFVILALLYLISFVQNHIKSSLTYLVLMAIFALLSGVELMRLMARPEVLAEYDDTNLYLHTGKQEITVAWEDLESAKRKGHKNRIGNVQYGEIIFLTNEKKTYLLQDVDNPDDVILTIQSILNKIDENK